MRTRPGARFCNSYGAGLELAASDPRRDDTARRLHNDPGARHRPAGVGSPRAAADRAGRSAVRHSHPRTPRSRAASLSRRPAALRLDGPRCRIRGTRARDSQRMVRAREQAPAGVALTFECELGYTFDPAGWGQGFATEAARCVRDYARDVLRLSYAISAILPQNARSARGRTVGRASRRSNGRGRSPVGSRRVAARDKRRGSAPAGIHEIGVARTGARGSAGSPAVPARTVSWVKSREKRAAATLHLS